MVKKVMICGIDCRPGDENCNNYCNHDTSKPMADHSPAETPAQRVASARRDAHEKLREAEKAWHEFFAECPVGEERTWASEVYDRIRHATAP